jgi:hypothetical protein
MLWRAHTDELWHILTLALRQWEANEGQGGKWIPKTALRELLSLREYPVEMGLLLT